MWIWIIALMVMVGIIAASIVIFSAELDEEYDDYERGVVLREKDIKEKEEEKCLNN